MPETEQVSVVLPLERPFFDPAVLAELDLRKEGLTNVKFGRDDIATRVTTALRQSIERLLEQHRNE